MDMQIACPECQKTYEIDDWVELENIVCSQCGCELSPEAVEVTAAEQIQSWLYKEHAFARAPLLSAEKKCNKEDQNPETPLQTEETEGTAQAELHAPTRRTVHIWPWFFAILLLITSAGIWIQKDAWLDNRWMRSTLINLSLPLENREKDWLIIPESVRIEWVKRHDDSRLMLITGSIKNLLASRMDYPEIRIDFFSNQQPDLKLVSQRLAITEKPDSKTISQSPFVKPARLKRAAAHSTTEFVLLIESMPEGVGDFTLSPKTH